MKFETGKTYKINSKIDFINNSTTNHKIFDAVGNSAWKVLVVDSDTDVIKIQLSNGRVIEPEDIDDWGLCVLFNHRDKGIIEVNDKLTQYKVGKTYKIDDIHFRNRLGVNHLIYEAIGDRPWTVVDIDENTGCIIKIKMVDSGVCFCETDFEAGCLFNEEDMSQIIEVETVEQKYAVIDVKGVVHYCMESKVDDLVKDLLTETPNSVISVFKFVSEYQSKLIVEKI